MARGLSRSARARAWACLRHSPERMIRATAPPKSRSQTGSMEMVIMGEEWLRAYTLQLKLLMKLSLTMEAYHRYLLNLELLGQQKLVAPLVFFGVLL